MKKVPSISKRAGFTIIEIILAVSVFALLVTGLAGSYLYGLETTSDAGEHSRATLYAAEGLEAARAIQDAHFSDLTDGNHGLSREGGTWTFSKTMDWTDIFSRSLTIVSIDADHKDVVSTVTWQNNRAGEESVTLWTRFTNWRAPVENGTSTNNGVQ